MKRVLLLFFFFFLGTNVYSSDLKLEAIGILSGQNLYLTYTSLNIASDFYEAQMNNSLYYIALAKEMASSSKKSRDTLQKLLDQNVLQGEDLVLGKNMIASYEVLISEAYAFISLIENRNSETIEKFKKYKGKAEYSVKSILKIED
jgi:hypothetical protein